MGLNLQQIRFYLGSEDDRETKRELERHTEFTNRNVIFYGNYKLCSVSVIKQP